MSNTRTDARRHPGGLRLLATLAVGLLALSTQALAALTVAPTSVTVVKGKTATVAISGAGGSIAASTSNTAVATVRLTNVKTATATATITGVAAGTATVTVKDRSTSTPVGVTVVPAMTATPTTMSLAVGVPGTITAANVSGTLTATPANLAIVTASVSGNVVTLTGVAAGTTTVAIKDAYTTLTVAVVVSASKVGAGYALIAWNDLGMHCMDGKDYSVMSILPPYNNLHAQLVNVATGKAVTTGVKVWYQAVADPNSSINTFSADVKKTNFWGWVDKLYSSRFAYSPAANVGLTGNYTPSKTARELAFDATNGWYAADGLPITPYSDKLTNGAYEKNYYPTVQVVATDLSGNVLATTVTVLPVSDEITCSNCHQSRTNTETNAARLAAKPSTGWVNNADSEKDWKLNILKLHDQNQATNPTYSAALTAMGYTPSLYGAATDLANPRPVLCAACHKSNALPNTGYGTIKALTTVQHASHAGVLDPDPLAPAGQTLNDATNRSACYNCHPGSDTACLRGAMSTSTVECQSCHGPMSKVGDAARVGWLQQPNCQACHNNGKRLAKAVDASGNLLTTTDTRFATNPNTPGTGFSLFRFSKGHGNMQCEACHGATHAEYPSTHDNDNLQSIALQGYEGTIRECTVCHKTVPLTGTGGPHGMHSIGAQWVDKHHDLLGTGIKSCTACHGADYRGGPLSQVQAPRSYKKKSSGTMNYAAGQYVSCYDCHNGPKP